MEKRIDYIKAAPDAVQAVAQLEQYLATESGLDPRYVHLLKLRASQINGCSYCVDTHTKEAREHGLSEQWIALICVWKESPIYNERERAVLRWTEALTNLSATGAPKEDYDELLAHFSEAEATKLTVAIGTINIWNRLAVGFRMQHPVDAAA